MSARSLRQENLLLNEKQLIVKRTTHNGIHQTRARMGSSLALALVTEPFIKRLPLIELNF